MRFPTLNSPLGRSLSIIALVLLEALVVISLFLILGWAPSLAVIVGGLLALSIFVLPELGLVLFYFAGQVKRWIPLFDPTTVTTTAILLAVTFIAILIQSLQKKSVISRLPRLGLKFIGLETFTILLLLSAGFLGNNSWSFLKALRFTLFSNAMVLGGWWTFHDPKKAERLMWFIMACGLITALGGILLPSYYGEGLSSFSDNYISFGQIIGGAVVIAMSALLSRRNNKIPIKILLIGGIAVGIIAILSSNTRGALIAVVVCAILLVIRLFFLRRRILAILLTTLILGFAYFILTSNQPIALQSTTNRFLGLLDFWNDRSALARIEIFQIAWHQFLSSPVWGIGIGNFKMYLGASPIPIEYAHNLFFELLAETGLIGLLLYLFPVISALRIVLSRSFRPQTGLSNDWIATGVLMALVFYLTSAQTSGDIQINRNLWLFVGLAWGFPRHL